MIEQFAKENFWFDKGGLLAKRLEEANISDAKDAGPVLQWLDLTVQLLGFPRHLGQHVGGFVLTQSKLSRLVPIQPATMQNRRIIQWDKRRPGCGGITQGRRAGTRHVVCHSA